MDTLLHNKALLNALTQLAKLGNKVTLISIRSREMIQVTEEIEVILVPLRYVPFLSSLMFALLLPLFLPLIIIKNKPEFIVFNPDLSFFNSLANLFFKIKRIKFILDVRSTPVETSGISGLLTNLFFSASMITAKRCFDGFTVLTEAMKKEICNRFLLPTNKVGVWSSGVSIDIFNPENLHNNVNLRNELGISEKFVVFYHGIFTANRGLFQTIEAIEALASLHPDVVFFILGNGPIENDLKSLIRNQKLEKSIIIHDPVSQDYVPQFIAMCDVCIVPLPNHPYWRCQSPLKLLEYLAMQKVTILTDIPAHRNVVGRQNCAIFISSIKPSEISAAINYAYSNRSNLVEWGKMGRVIVEKEYTWQKIAIDLQNYLLIMRQQA